MASLPPDADLPLLPPMAFPSAWSLPEVVASLPTACVLLTPTLHVAAASDTYLMIYGLTRTQLLGRTLFEVFPGAPGTPEGYTITSLRASLQQVLATGEPHHMAVQQYDVPDPTNPGQIMGRYWDPTNSPIRNAQGTVTGLVHSVVNVTEQVQAETELRASEGREQTAVAEAEAERQRLRQMLLRMPANIALLRGPEHTYDFVNPEYERLFPGRTTLGRTIREVIPELEGQGFYELFDRVYETGQPFYEAETEAWADFEGTGELQCRYYRTTFEPIRNAQGEVAEVLNFAVDVTEQVTARQQVLTLNEELAAINEELRASNEEYLQANADLSKAQQQLQQLNQELEFRVRERTRQFEAAQQATERQRRRWHELFMRAPASICIFDGPEWVYEFVNPGYQAMFPGRELLGKRLVDALPEVADQPLMAILHHVYDTGETFEGKEVLVPLARTDDGPIEDIYFDLTYQARYNDKGQIDGFITYAYDVTEQVLARRERETRQGELQRVFEQAPVAIGLFMGEELRITALNPHMAALFGLPAEQLLGRPLLEGLPELRGQGFDDLMRQVQMTQVPFLGQELPVTLTRNGEPTVTYYNLVYQPLYGVAGQVEGVFEVAVEVTEQVLARQQVHLLNEELTATNEELHETNSQLVRTNADLDNFVYTASHDLKSPISNIEGLLALLPELLPDAVLADAHVAPVLSRMQESIERFQRTIKHLTDVSQLQAEFAQPAETVPLAAVIEDVRQDLHFQFLETGAVLNVAVEGMQPRVFSPKNLRSLIYNLLSNALKYYHPERVPRVHISCQLVSNVLELRVQDNGLGLNAAQQQRLFQLFQRLHTHIEGTGVGLYAVKKIVENAGGHITVESELGVGTTFILTFPA
jgi:PAS domain S-box-containing protein